MEWSDGKCRCRWANPKNERYIRYHDKEWGQPVHEDGKLFEMLILESFQAGLSWECVLNKREAFRQAFDQFAIEKIVVYDEKKEEELKANPQIIRNRLKIHAAVVNAQTFREIRGDEIGIIRSDFEGFEEERHEICGNHDHLFLSSGSGSDLFS